MSQVNEKPENPKVVQNAIRNSEVPKDFWSMSEEDKQKNWDAYMNSFKKN